MTQTTIEPGKLYRRKSDGAKLMALEVNWAQSKHGPFWEFYLFGSKEKCGVLVSDYADHVEPWREPERVTIKGDAYMLAGGSTWLVRRTEGDDRPADAFGGERIIARKRFTVELVEGEIEE
jgi:hypothetical protein